MRIWWLAFLYQFNLQESTTDKSVTSTTILNSLLCHTLALINYLVQKSVDFFHTVLCSVRRSKDHADGAVRQDMERSGAARKRLLPETCGISLLLQKSLRKSVNCKEKIIIRGSLTGGDLRQKAAFLPPRRSEYFFLSGLGWLLVGLEYIYDIPMEINCLELFP